MEIFTELLYISVLTEWYCKVSTYDSCKKQVPDISAPKELLNMWHFSYQSEKKNPESSILKGCITDKSGKGLAKFTV